MPKLDEFLQIAEAAEHLGVCANTLRNWGRNGKIKQHRHPINNYRLFKTVDLDRLLKKANKSSAPPSAKRTKAKPR